MPHATRLSRRSSRLSSDLSIGALAKLEAKRRMEAKAGHSSRATRDRLSRERRFAPRPSDCPSPAGAGEGGRRPGEGRWGKITLLRRGIQGEGRDRLSRERRSWNMSRIRGKNTTPEKVVRSLLHRLGYRFRLHRKIPIPQLSTKNPQPSQRRFITPDIVLVRQRVAIFVHGCFWHRHRGCENCTTPTHRREWWLKKLNGNAARDMLHQRALRKLGWRPVVVWECETEKLEKLVRLQTRLERTLPAAKDRKCF